MIDVRQQLSLPSGPSLTYYPLPLLEKGGIARISRLPVSLRILLESVLRNRDGRCIHDEDVDTLTRWQPGAAPDERRVTHGPAAPGTPAEADRRTLYTIGHSTRSASELIDVLRAASVTRVVDIRSIPMSRTNPQFGIEVLPETLAGAGLDYVHLPALGGLRANVALAEEGTNAGWVRRPFRNYADYARTPPFRDGLHALLDMASRQTCAIMCAEAVWWRCHRRIVTDHVLAHGMPVIHLLTRTKSAPASLTPFAVVDAQANVSYPVPEPRAEGERRRRRGTRP